MSNAHLDNVIPDGTVRRNIYRVFAAIGLLIGATQVGFASLDLGQPAWLTAALAVYGFLGAAGFYTAQANTPTTAEQRQARADDVDLALYEAGDKH